MGHSWDPTYNYYLKFQVQTDKSLRLKCSLLKTYQHFLLIYLIRFHTARLKKHHGAAFA